MSQSESPRPTSRLEFGTKAKRGSISGLVATYPIRQAYAESSETLATSTSASSMGPPGLQSSPETEPRMLSPESSSVMAGNSGMIQQAGSSTSTEGASSSQAPKVVQTAFVHKLYSMLEDGSISNLISWSSNNESFIIAPTAEFAKVLAQYFKHTNISSFVRQLNMYGFHKVSDVFHTGTPDSMLWEFKHGSGSFRRGDLASLKDIKRRASRHTISHRESFSTPAPHSRSSLTRPSTPAEAPIDSTEARISHLEHRLNDMHARLTRSEDNNAILGSKCAFLHEGLTRVQQWSSDLNRMISSIVPDTDHPVKRDAQALEEAMFRQNELMRRYSDDNAENLLSGQQARLTSLALADSLSPRRVSAEEYGPRRRSRPVPLISSKSSSGLSHRAFGSIGSERQMFSGSGSGSGSIGSSIQTQMQQPLATVIEPASSSNGRRHTFGDVGDVRVPSGSRSGSIGQHSTSAMRSLQFPVASGSTAQAWSAQPATADRHSEQQIREQLAAYEFGKSFEPTSGPPTVSQGDMTIPTSTDITPSTQSTGSSIWSWNSAGARPGRILDSAPATRRSSMASNVHSLLNPSDDADAADDRKRKRP